MKKHSAGSRKAISEDLRAQQRAHVVMRERDKLGGERQIVRKETIAEAIREWVIPAFVRRFLTEKTSKRPSGSDVPTMPRGALEG